MNIDLKSLDLGTILTTFFGLIGTIIGATLVYLKGKREVDVSAQTALNSGFGMLVDEFQEEAAKDALRIAEQEEKISKMQDEIFSLHLHKIALETLLRTHNIPIPPMAKFRNG